MVGLPSNPTLAYSSSGIRVNSLYPREVFCMVLYEEGCGP